MNGALTFTLGLETQQFLRNLGFAAGGVLSFAGLARGVSVAIRNVWGSIESGGRLLDQSARTGASVKSLYQLEEAYKLVGLSADQVAPMLVRLQRAFGGVEDPAAKLVEIAREINSAGSGGVTLAAKIFGREGTGDIMQIARQLGDFTRSLTDTGAAATKAQQTAAAFDRIGDTIQRLKTQARGFWLSIAAEAAPVIQWALNALTDAFKSGTVSQLIADSLKLGFESILDFAPAIFEKLGFIILSALKKPLTFFQAALEFSIQKLGEQIMANPVIRVLMGGSVFGLWANKNLPMGYKSESWEDIYSRYQKSGPIFNFGSGEFGLGDINKDADERWKDAVSSFKFRFGSAFNLAPFKPGGGDNPLDLLGRGLAKPDASQLEKMGFVFGGGRADYTRSIAENTRRTAEGVDQLAKALTGRGLDAGNLPPV